MTAEGPGALPRGPLEDRRAALADVAARTAGAVALSALPPAACVVVRAVPEPGVLARLGAATGVSLPVEPNRVAFAILPDAPAERAAWLGPDEWLVMGPLERLEIILARLEAARGDDHVSIVDVSAARTAVALGGEGARDLLATGCGLDLHPRAFPSGTCAQTGLARAAVLIEALEEAAGFRITVRPSFARYLADWLLDAALEFTVEAPAAP